MGHQNRVATILVLAVVLGLAAFLRGYGLENSPPSVNWDEAALGYNAYSIWLTGKDEYGSPWPISFRSFDDYKPPLYVYLTAPIVGIWGLTEVTTRTVSLVGGLVSVGLIYLVAANLTHDRRAGLLAGLLLAIEPWAIYFSRGAWEANLSLTLLLATVWLLLKKRWSWAAAMAGVNVLAYHSAKIYLWPILLYTGVKRAWIATSIALVIFTLSVTAGSGLTRFGSTSIFRSGSSSRSVFLLVGEMVERYFSYFNPANLFVRGSSEPNQRVEGWASFYAFESALWLTGWWILKRKWRSYKLLIGWLFLAPLPAMVTSSWFNPLRVLPALAAQTVLVAIGGLWWWDKVSHLPLRVAGAGAVGGWAVINVCAYFLALVLYLPYKNSGDWQWGFKQVVSQISDRLEAADKVVWETSQAQPHIFVLFYLKYPPQAYHQEITDASSPRKNFDFGKFEFRKIYWPDDHSLSHTIFVGTVYSLPQEVAAARVYDLQGYETARIVIPPP